MRASAPARHEQSTSAAISKKVDIAKRAGEELAAAMAALQRTHLLFTLIEQAASGAEPNKNQVFLLAQIGAEIAACYGERAASEADFFADAEFFADANAKAESSSEGI